MKTMKNVLVAVVAMMVVGVLCVGSVKADLVIDNPYQLIGTGNGQAMRMNSGDNLMERVGGVDYVVDKGEGEYYIFFGKDISGGLVFGAYLETDNDNSDNYAGYEGWCNGNINRDTFLRGESPNYVLTIYDDDGGQFAALNQITGALSFDENIIAWESGYSFISGSGGIEYEGVVDGLLDINFGVIGGGTIFFESVVLTSVPEPATIALLGIGLALMMKRKR